MRQSILALIDKGTAYEAHPSFLGAVHCGRRRSRREVGGNVGNVRHNRKDRIDHISFRSGSRTGMTPSHRACLPYCKDRPEMLRRRNFQSCADFASGPMHTQTSATRD